MHKSAGKKHARKIIFDDSHVVLLGIQDKETLFEYLQGPALAIEVHDRDRNLMLKKEAACVFGQNEDDAFIGNASMIASELITVNSISVLVF